MVLCNVARVCVSVVPVQVSRMRPQAVPFNSNCAFCLRLHMWKTEVKVTETEQTSFPLLSSAAAVTFCPGRFGSRPSSAHLLQSII